MKNRVPPPVFMLLFAGSIYFSHQVYPWTIGSPAARKLLALLSVAVAIYFLFDSVRGFFREKTTVNPLKPSSASALVTHGVYRYSRNPMYLGMLLLLMAVALYIGNPLGFVFVLAFGLVMNLLQIAPEEKALAEKFGADYISYCEKVRRWL